MPFFATMLTNALLMSLLAMLYLLLRVPLQRHVKPAACYALGMIVTLGLLIPLRPALPVSLLRTTAPIQQADMSDVDLPGTIPYDYDFTTDEHQQRLAQAQLTNEPATLDIAVSPASSAGLWRIAAIVWLCGIVLMLLYHMIRHLRFRHLIRRWHSGPDSVQRDTLSSTCAAQGIKRQPRLWRCGAVQAPMLIGLFRPTILLPRTAFSADELALILRHELVHLKRRDLWYKALVLASVCLYWWNPLVRRMARAVSADCEMSCDDTVLSGADLTQRKLYGETILGAITRQATPHAALSTYFYERRCDMKRRFISMLNVRPRRAGGLAIAACLCLTFFTGSVFATEGTAPVASTAQAVSPTTGMRYPTGRDDAYRPILAEFSNIEEARPQIALSLADIVYEYIYWGPGYTRYLALYNDYHPEMVGPIRSTKTSGMSLRNSWDCPIVYIGGEDSDAVTSVYRFIETHEIPGSMLFDGSRESGVLDDIFSRITTREMPNNAVVSLQKLVSDHWPMDADGTPYEPALPALRFADTPSKGDAAATEVIIPYDERDYLVRYTYDATDGQYKRWYNGEPQLDGLTGQRITADNVIVLHAELTYPTGAESQPLWGLTGTGKLDAFIGGTHISGTWQRSEEADAFEYFDANGSPLLLTPGKTFIQIVPLEMQIHYNG